MYKLMVCLVRCQDHFIDEGKIWKVINLPKPDTRMQLDVYQS